MSYISETKNKKRYNDEGNVVPEKCPKCGSKVGIMIQGEPIFRCTNDKCKEFFGGVPFPGTKYSDSPKKGKTVKIDEDTEVEIIGGILTESFTPKTEQVLRVVDFLNTYISVDLSQLDVDSNGRGHVVPMFVEHMKGDDRPIQNMNAETLLLRLDSEFHGIIRDDSDRREFLKQVIRDWYGKTKGLKHGLLSVNRI